jgi:hypothetical protein
VGSIAKADQAHIPYAIPSHGVVAFFKRTIENLKPCRGIGLKLIVVKFKEQVVAAAQHEDEDDLEAFFIIQNN